MRPEDVAASIPCGDDVENVVEAALVRIGGDHQETVADRAEKELLPALREL
ncbi:hypothetical protein [Streptomyces aureus]|uniref:hypothetical protein n=1 Tax=Streptomyces aureus TaxID=193461 RepID=UPI003F54150F